MTPTISITLVSLALMGGDAKEPAQPKLPEFEAPKPLTGGGAPIRTEDPGYAAPELFDVTGDGRKDLIVGQFAGGKIAVYPGLEDGTYGEREWLQAGGAVAEVPGVW